jgi:hypothetical protein
MEKIEGKKDHFMIKVSKTDVEIRRIKDVEDDDELIKIIIGSENKPGYIWQFFNEITGDWQYLFVKRYNQYTQDKFILFQI